MPTIIQMSLFRSWYKWAALAITALVFLTDASAQANSWTNNGDGFWQDAPNWSLGASPTNDHSILITNANTKTVWLTNAPPEETLTVSNLTVGALAGQTNILWLDNVDTNSPLRVLNNFSVGGGGALVLSNAALRMDGLGSWAFNVDGSATFIDSQLNSTNLNVGTEVGATGSVWVSNSRVIVVGSTVIGNAGVGEMTISNGVVSVGAMSIADGPDSQGTLTLAGGVLQSASYPPLLAIGAGMSTSPGGATGTLWVTGGRLSMGGDIRVGSYAALPPPTNSCFGQMIVSNGTVSAYRISMGSVYDHYGGSRLTIAGGTVSMVMQLEMYGRPGASNAVWITGGRLQSTASLPPPFSTIFIDLNSQMTVSNGIVNVNYAEVGRGRLVLVGGTNTFPYGLAVGGRSGVTGSVQVVGGIISAGPIKVFPLARFALDGGSVSGTQLVLSNSMFNAFTFDSGTLSSGGTFGSTNQLFTVGNGINPATFRLAGGTHSFVKGLRIRSNASLTGCGTISGNVLADAGGTVVVDCGGTMTFTGIVTNYGTLRVINGGVLEAYGTVVNNGTIDAINGTTNFHGAFINNGILLDATSVRISQASESGENFVVQIPSVIGHTYQLQYTVSLTPTNWINTGIPQSGTGEILTFTDLGGSTNTPARFYRAQVTAP